MMRLSMACISVVVVVSLGLSRWLSECLICWAKSLLAVQVGVLLFSLRLWMFCWRICSAIRWLKFVVVVASAVSHSHAIQMTQIPQFTWSL